MLRRIFRTILVLTIWLTGCDSVLGYQEPTAEQMRAVRNDAESIAQSLLEWRAANGSFPARLDMLVPAARDSIPPQPVGDKQWRYGLRESDGFAYLSICIGPDCYPSETLWIDPAGDMLWRADY